jgi:tetratricopeptide (TPR) repeat protein
MTGAVTAALAALFLQVAPAAPPAQLDPEQELLARAARHYDEGRFEEAVADYLEGHRRYGKPGYFFNVGQVYREAGNCAKAFAAYDRFLQEAPPDDERRPRAQRYRQDLRPCALPSPPPSVAQIRSPPPPLVPPPRDEAPPGSARMLRTTGLALLGVAVASAVGTGVFAALGLKYDAEASRLAGGPYGREAMDVWAKGERANLMTVVLGVTTLATAAGGAGLLIFGPATTAPSGDRSVASVPVGVRWAGRF